MRTSSSLLREKGKGMRVAYVNVDHGGVPADQILAEVTTGRYDIPECLEKVGRR